MEDAIAYKELRRSGSKGVGSDKEEFDYFFNGIIKERFVTISDITPYLKQLKKEFDEAREILAEKEVKGLIELLQANADPTSAERSLTFRVALWINAHSKPPIPAHEWWNRMESSPMDSMDGLVSTRRKNISPRILRHLSGNAKLQRRVQKQRREKVVEIASRLVKERTYKKMT